MSSVNDFNELVAKFRLLGVSDPEAWARSQTSEGINQLHRALFLRQAWAKVIPEADDSWIDIEANAAEQAAAIPFAGVGLALRRLLDAGAQRRDLVDLVRGMQARLLVDFCYLLDDPAVVEPELDGVGWCLVETNDDFEPTENSIGGLHESVLETDPAGREMRPRASS